MSSKCDVLVVDDEPVVRDAIRLVLGSEGFAVETVPDAEAALAHPAFADCRLVICDLMLPGLPGLDLIQAIRARRAGVAILAITGYATGEVATRAASAGATLFLAKPFDHDELSDQVRRVLQRTDAASKEERS